MKADKQSCRSLSKFHFHRLFQESVCVSPSRYHMNLRMDEAKRLLRETMKSVASVALDAGYANPSHFAQLFRRETAFPPAITVGSADADSFQRKDTEAQRDGVTPFAGIRITRVQAETGLC